MSDRRPITLFIIGGAFIPLCGSMASKYENQVMAVVARTTGKSKVRRAATICVALVRVYNA